LVPPHKKLAREVSNSELLKRIQRLEATLTASNTDRVVDAPSSDESWPTSAFPQDILVDKAGPCTKAGRTSTDETHSLGVPKPEGKVDGLTFSIASTCELIDGDHWQSDTGQSVVAQKARAMLIPTFKVAMVLYKSYESILDGMCRILHMPTLRALIESFYIRVAQAEDIPSGEAAMVLAVLAVSAFFTPQVQHTTRVSRDTPAALSKALAEHVVRALDHSRRTTAGSLEDVQASILMSYIDYHHHGYSPRGRMHIGNAILLSRDLGLHRVDADTDVADSTLTPKGRLDKEVRRRVFWFLASAEW
jgi:hypothetical protein